MTGAETGTVEDFLMGQVGVATTGSDGVMKPPPEISSSKLF